MQCFLNGNDSFHNSGLRALVNFLEAPWHGIIIIARIGRKEEGEEEGVRSRSIDFSSMIFHGGGVDR
ncbi:hypothetical protein GOP47_0002513 [Adiantum capillus-veneris]|uniref:Uncharacterized protein n=1 Tax=Adiantum capillus-veneris TaxID=13818 RepID=A0A9D4VA89_ADICA|nr:hypothetical protein GOP47_0002513 [Adiantum capillus-veneris]